MNVFLEIVKYVLEFQNPIAVFLGVLIIGFLGWRKFTTSEYVSSGKQSMDAMKVINDTQAAELKQVKEELRKTRIENEALLKTATEQAREIEELRDQS